ncbi:MAG: 23S rRNA pseudouridine(1911/1915/1917) synthase RluD [Proteobacteria bacterium]|nr:23S rRNA pseudouridine(1911/1915/1917) synthase RluD [Pseudomonadota bacterium]
MSEVRHHNAEFGAAEAGMRLDQALAKLFSEYSRSSIKLWIESGHVTVNAQICRPRYAVRTGDVVQLTAILEASKDLQPDVVDFEVVHADEDCIVVNKPAGCVVHPGAGNARNTLANGLIQIFPELAALPRAGLIHRLDKNTSGLLIVARNSNAYQLLIKQMAARGIKRIYDTVVNGKFISGGTVDAAIGRDPANRTRMTVREGGRRAVTHYRIGAKFRMHTHLEVELETGRTHQIRVHLAHIGHPVVGDGRYGGRLLLPPQPHVELENYLRYFPRQALHARQLEFEHPINSHSLCVESPMPGDMRQLLGALAIDLSSLSD